MGIRYTQVYNYPSFLVHFLRLVMFLVCRYLQWLSVIFFQAGKSTNKDGDSVDIPGFGYSSQNMKTAYFGNYGWNGTNKKIHKITFEYGKLYCFDHVLICFLFQVTRIGLSLSLSTRVKSIVLGITKSSLRHP